MVNVAEGILLALDVLALLVAVAITVTSYKAYRRVRSQRYRFAFVGFVFLVAGLASEAVLFRVGDFQIVLVHTVETLFFLVGFTALYLSLK